MSCARCNLRDDGATAIFDGIERNMQLKHLNLQENRITNAGGKFIA